MRVLSWQFCALAALAILLGAAHHIPSAHSQEVDFTTPNWPPHTTEPPLDTTTTTDEDTDGTTVIPPTSPAPPANGAGDDGGNGWMITGIIFICLTIIFAAISVYLYMSLPGRSRSSDKAFVLPRVNAHN